MTQVWDGSERRENYKHLEDRLREVEMQLATLNGSLPELKNRLTDVANKIEVHEGNAAKRAEASIKCRIAREKNTGSIHSIRWVIGTLLTINAGMVIALLREVFK